MGPLATYPQMIELASVFIISGGSNSNGRPLYNWQFAMQGRRNMP